MLSKETQRLFGGILYDVIPETAEVVLRDSDLVEEEFEQQFTIHNLNNYSFSLTIKNITSKDGEHKDYVFFKVWLKDTLLKEYIIIDKSKKIQIYLYLSDLLKHYKRRLKRDVKQLIGYEVSHKELSEVLAKFYD